MNEFWHGTRSDRQDRRRRGKSDPLDAISAARAAQSGRARGKPRGRTIAADLGGSSASGLCICDRP